MSDKQHRHQSGAGLTEYALLVALIAMVGLISVRFYGASAFCTASYSAWRIRYLEWYDWDPSFFEDKARYMNYCIRERMKDRSIEDIHQGYQTEYGFFIE